MIRRPLHPAPKRLRRWPARHGGGIPRTASPWRRPRPPVDPTCTRTSAARARGQGLSGSPVTKCFCCALSRWPGRILGEPAPSTSSKAGATAAMAAGPLQRHAGPPGLSDREAQLGFKLSGGARQRHHAAARRWPLARSTAKMARVATAAMDSAVSPPSSPPAARRPAASARAARADRTVVHAEAALRRAGRRCRRCASRRPRRLTDVHGSFLPRPPEIRASRTPVPHGRHSITKAPGQSCVRRPRLDNPGHSHTCPVRACARAQTHGVRLAPGGRAWPSGRAAGCLSLADPADAKLDARAGDHLRRRWADGADPPRLS